MVVKYVFLQGKDETKPNIETQKPIFPNNEL